MKPLSTSDLGLCGCLGSGCFSGGSYSGALGIYILELWQESLDDVERHLLTKAEARFLCNQGFAEGPLQKRPPSIIVVSIFFSIVPILPIIPPI